MTLANPSHVSKGQVTEVKPQGLKSRQRQLKCACINMTAVVGATEPPFYLIKMTLSLSDDSKTSDCLDLSKIASFYYDWLESFHRSSLLYDVPLFCFFIHNQGTNFTLGTLDK